MQYHNRQRGDQPEIRGFRTAAERPRALLRQCPVYTPTPLHNARRLATELGIADLWLKDETQRMRLGSFKALGGAFAVAQMIAEAAGTTDLDSPEARSTAAELTFITASAGNHGLSVAAGARLFGSRSVIVLGPSVPEGFAMRIRDAGGIVERAGKTYEDSVAHGMALAEKNGWILLADGSWEGYVDRPALVMEGYSVLAEECRSVFQTQGRWPTHVLLQAGVGGLAAAGAAHIRDHWAEQPEIIVVEPEAAPCLLTSVRNGKLTRADGPISNMGRLDCKDASLLSYQSLRRDADLFVTVTDQDAVDTVDQLKTHGIATTPSGAAGITAIRQLEPQPDWRILGIISEGPETG